MSELSLTNNNRNSSSESNNTSKYVVLPLDTWLAPNRQVLTSPRKTSSRLQRGRGVALSQQEAQEEKRPEEIEKCY